MHHLAAQLHPCSLFGLHHSLPLVNSNMCQPNDLSPCITPRTQTRMPFCYDDTCLSHTCAVEHVIGRPRPRPSLLHTATVHHPTCKPNPHLVPCPTTGAPSATCKSRTGCRACYPSNVRFALVTGENDVFQRL
eukprot:scaffold105672_cov34-Tisochrysis_lutea.AAC.2